MAEFQRLIIITSTLIPSRERELGIKTNEKYAIINVG